jgi:hypothetical protein
MRTIVWQRGTTNLDFGGGKYDTATGFLATQGVTNLVYDPFNRPTHHNIWLIKDIMTGRISVDSATLCNVLNVIKEADIRNNVLRNVRTLTRFNREYAPHVFISCYRGRGDEPGQTCNGWQENRPLKTYLPEVMEVFGTAYIEKNMIVAF